ncbi:ABC transporter substrate-binding protein [Neobacillus novalis]|uniref:ABC transporter substrate-binding protein n=1 Tax=Neobacillus novalis TaxID=220687 RepID=A0AA95MRD0_9BACI|nr:ABC transporter substrate-binding protein [Neobacillus novalis]WHY86588.1 ABC transporter substrate-binding protein [Neobacillus novalis]
MAKKKTTKMGMLVLILLLILSACSSNSTGTDSKGTTKGNDGEAVKGGKINIDMSADFSHLDPAMCYDFGCYEVVTQFYNMLVTYEPDSTKLVGSAAEEFNISDDGLTYTFKLKKGVKFHNGTEMTAQSFIDEFKRILDPEVGSPGKGFIDPLVIGSTDFSEGKAKEISGITAPDPYTLVIKITEPQGTFLNVLAMPFFPAIDKQYVDSIGNKEFDHKPMGTGPWKLKSYNTGKDMVLEKNADYFVAGFPKLDEITITFEKNAQSSALKFKQGDTAFIGWNQLIGSSDFIQFQQDSKYKDLLQSQTLVSTYYLALNNQVKPFDNKLVRQAVNMAIDKEKLVKLNNGRATATNQILPPDMPGYQKDLPAEVDYKFNKEKAKELLKEAGFADGFKTTMLTTSSDQATKEAQSIQSDLKEIGIDVEIRPLSGSSYSDGARSLKYGMVSTAWFQDYPDPSNFLDVLLNGSEVPANNWAAYNNPVVNDMLKKASTLSPGQERWAAFSEIQLEVLKDAPWVPLYTPVRYAIVQPWLKGFYQHPVWMDPLQNISVTKH